MSRFLSVSDIRSILGISRLLLTNPRKLYSFMPLAGGYRDPLVFVGVMSVLGGVSSMVARLLVSGGFGLSGSVSMLPMWYVLFWPLLGVVYSFATAGMMYMVWRFLGSDKGFEVAYRCIAYTCILIPIFSLATLFPYIGLVLVIVGWVWLLAQATEVVYEKPKLKVVLLR
ncbi:MAG: hypothetical protein GKR96_11130 [Gammaproteobacteria bacterium]|nr:hypothetical protein [Gammaproteobacteria bacterium]